MKRLLFLSFIGCLHSFWYHAIPERCQRGGDGRCHNEL